MQEWYNAHRWLATDSLTDYLVVMLKFHPVFYFHIYVFGILAAIFMYRWRRAPPLALRYGSVLGYGGLALLFLSEPLQPPAFQLTTRLGVLAPLHGLALAGLTVGTDPVARLLAWPPLAALSK